MNEPSTTSGAAVLAKSPPKPKSKPTIELQIAYDTLIRAYDRIYRLQRIDAQRPLRPKEKEKRI